MNILKGEEVYLLKKISEGTYKSGPNEGKPYVVMSHAKKGFTIEKEVYDAWVRGEIASFALEDSKYERENPVTSVMETIESLAYAGHVTNKQQLNVATQQGRLEGIKRQVAAEYKLDPATLAAAI